MKIDPITEKMFAQAVALAQNGNMKNTIHCFGKEIFILNMDSTILIRFKSPQEFPEMFSFFANDYESPRIHIQNGQVVFKSTSDGVKRTKVCPSPKTDFKEVRNIWEQCWKTWSGQKKIPVNVTKSMVSLLEPGLSHVELSKDKGPFVLIQRDIYSGSRIEIEKSDGLLAGDNIPSFGPIGIRTADLIGLYTFTATLTLYIQPKNNFIYFEDNTGRMSGILALCLYDELGTLGKACE
jgi:hypothetical protein